VGRSTCKPEATDSEASALELIMRGKWTDGQHEKMLILLKITIKHAFRR